MSATRQRPFRRVLSTVACVAGAAVLVTGCTSNSPSSSASSSGSSGGGGTASSNNDAAGQQITIGFSAPAADHGWMAAITNDAKATAGKYPDVKLDVAAGTNDVNTQISQVETFINQKVSAIVLLPFDGAALTPVAQKAMDAGIPVINVDRQFDSVTAARATVLGDNYGMGRSAGTYICDRLKGKPNAVVAEIAGIDSLPLTQDRSRGFKEALATCGLKVNNRVAAEFTVESGEAAASNLLQAAPHIDAIWNHDDDQGVGVMAAVKNSGRKDFFMVGGAGSANAMRSIKAGDTPLQATVIYPSTQGADAVKIARLIAQKKAMSDLVEIEVPKTITLTAPVVTKDNVDQYLGSAFES